MSIEVKNISKVYGKQHALDQVSLSIGSGEVVGFLGPNGAGKSTMMKILTTYINPTYGEAFVAGHNVVEESLEVRKKVGYLPEHNPLYLEMYVQEYLRFIAGLYKLKNKKQLVNDILHKVGLDDIDHRNKKIGALSKGYRQRVGLAQALIHDPEVLILDEPTSGLDPNQLADIRALISSIGKEKTVLLSTHIMQEVEALCDRVIIINKGQIVADKDAQGLVASSGQKEKVLLVEFNSELTKSALHKIDGVRKASNVEGNKWELTVDEDIRSAVFDFAVANNVQVLTQVMQERSLEDVFKELTATD
jgi:ABC-2 type transport system ATP-binding protein